MAEKILVVGGGGREHAIIKALKKSPDCGEIWCAPGNGGTSYDAKCKNIKATDVDTMVGFAVEEKFDYVVVAQDDPLALGMVDALKQGDLSGVASRMENVLETVTTKLYPQIEEIKQTMKESGAENAIMSGSGPTVFGIFDDKEKGKQAREILKQGTLARQVYLVRPYNIRPYHK